MKLTPRTPIPSEAKGRNPSMLFYLSNHIGSIHWSWVCVCSLWSCRNCWPSDLGQAEADAPTHAWTFSCKFRTLDSVLSLIQMCTRYYPVVGAPHGATISPAMRFALSITMCDHRGTQAAKHCNLCVHACALVQGFYTPSYLWIVSTKVPVPVLIFCRRCMLQRTCQQQSCWRSAWISLASCQKLSAHSRSDSCAYHCKSAYITCTLYKKTSQLNWAI